LEELIYWGAIFLFYIFSAYRSRQKKQNSEEVFAPKPLSNQENKSKNSDFNIFEFLDEAMEKSTIDLEELPKTVNSEINTVDTLRAKSTTKQDSYSVNDIKVEKKYDFNEKHLSHLETKINLSSEKKYINIKKTFNHSEKTAE